MDGWIDRSINRIYIVLCGTGKSKFQISKLIVTKDNKPCNVVILLCICIKCGITWSSEPCHLHDAPGHGQEYGLHHITTPSY